VTPSGIITIAIVVAAIIIGSVSDGFIEAGDHGTDRTQIYVWVRAPGDGLMDIGLSCAPAADAMFTDIQQVTRERIPTWGGNNYVVLPITLEGCE